MSKLFLFFCLVTIVACNSKGSKNNSVTAIKNLPAMVDSAGWPASFGFGRDADTATINKLDIDISPDGRGLPQGGANAIDGSIIYAAKCLACHGGVAMTTGIKFPAPALINNPDSPKVKTIGNYWPYATTIFDYVRRAMPYNAPGSLTNDEVYAVTAYLLHTNKLFDSVTVLNAVLLPKIIMPAQKRFVADDRTGGPVIK